MFEAAEVTAAAVAARVAATARVRAASERISADATDAGIQPESAHAARCTRRAAAHTSGPGDTMQPWTVSYVRLGLMERL